MKTGNRNLLMIAAALYAVSSGYFISARFFGGSMIAWALAAFVMYTLVVYWIQKADEIRNK